MFCQNCGQPQLPGFSFCSRCGWKLIKPEDMVNPVPTTETPMPIPAPVEAAPEEAVVIPASEEADVPASADEATEIAEEAPVAENEVREEAVPAAEAEEAPMEAEAPSNPYELPGSDPAAIPDESGTYVSPVRPCSPAPNPQYGYGYPGTAPQYPPYPYYGAPVPQYPPQPYYGAPMPQYPPQPYYGAPMPQYPPMPAASYTPYPYVPYPVCPTPPAVPQPPAPAPVMPPVVKDMPPAKIGRRRVPIIIMAILLLAGLLLFFFGPGKSTSLPQDGTAQTQSETPWFRNEDGTLYFDAERYTGPSELVVPETVDGQTVTILADDCFAGNDTITTVVLPATLEEIGAGAFADCTNLRGIFIPDGVELIGSNAFENCTSLEAIHIPSSVSIIGRSAFQGCSELEYIMYDGTSDEWYALYSNYINTNTKVYCSDGTVPQGRRVP